MTAPKKVIAVDHLTKSPAVQAIRDRLKHGAPSGWHAIEFGTIPAPDNHFDDLIAQLAALHATAINELEVVAEGHPWALDSINASLIPGIAAKLGTRLKNDVPGFENATVLYLSGCNTGCAPGTYPGAAHDAIGQLVANTSDATVMGALGYIDGTRAFHDETCTKVYNGPGSHQGEYPGSVDAKKNHCWRAFNSQAEHALMQPLFLFKPLSQELVEMLMRDVAAAPIAAPSYRVAADRIIPLPAAGNRPRSIEVIANGDYLRDPDSYAVWPSTGGSRLVELLSDPAYHTRKL